MNRLETYLQQATAGLWGRKRREVIEELRGSIEARVWALEYQGHDAGTALEMALRELGDARAVNVGMTKVHLMPTAIRGTVLALLFAGTALVSWQTSQAQVQIAKPNVTFWASRPDSDKPAFYSMNDLQASLEASGVTVEVKQEPPLASSRWSRYTTDGWMPKNPDTTKTLVFQLSGATAPTVLQALPGWSIGRDGLEPSYEANEDVFLNSSYLFETLESAGLPMRIEGWHNPTILIGKTKFTLGTSATPTTAFEPLASVANSGFSYHVYSHSLNLPSAFIIGPWNTGKVQLPLHSVRVQHKPGTVYAAFTISNPVSSFAKFAKHKAMIFMDLARVDDQGVLQFYAPWNAVEFVADPKKLEPDQRALEQVKYEPAKIGLGTTKRPAKIVLMRLTGRYDRLERNTIFEMPARSRSVASR